MSSNLDEQTSIFVRFITNKKYLNMTTNNKKIDGMLTHAENVKLFYPRFGRFPSDGW